MRRRYHKTAADYAVIAICPALIIVMLTALVHFLVLCLYRGDYPGRLMYILFLFIVAATLIARIAIEQGRAYAFGYALALGLATFVVIGQFVVLSGPMAQVSGLFNLLLLALIWWLADRITFDCTVIDDADRASGEGLVSAGGLFGGAGSLGARRHAPATRADVALDGTTSTEPTSRVARGSAADEDSRAFPPKRRGHKPGRWVLYLAFAALPLFGAGQLLLPDFDSVRSGALRSLGLYLFATLTLLVTTSFLGLRRYLRQRGAEMPGEVSVAWLGGGALLVAAVLLVGFMVPLPGRLIAAIDVPKWIQSREGLEPSRFGWGDEGAGPPRQDGTASGNEESSEPQASQSGEPTDSRSSGAANSQQGQPSSQQSGGQQSGGGQSGGEQSGGEQSGGEQSGGEQSGGEQSGGEQSGGEQSGGEQSGGEQSGGEQSGGEQSGGEQSGGEQSGGEQSGGEQSGGEQSGGEQSGSEQPGSQRSRGEQPGSSQPGGEPPAGDQPDGELSGSDQPRGDQRPSGEAAEQSQTAESERGTASERESDGATAGERPSAAGASRSTPSLPPIGAAIARMLKLVVVAALLAVIALFMLKNRHLIRQWWEGLLAFFRGERATRAAMEIQPAAAPAKPARPFASFRNPLADGSDPAAAVVVSFQALEAWGRERGLTRGDEETPTEYLRRARQLLGDAAPAGERLADAYNRIVYGRGKPTRGDLVAVERTWQTMTAGR